MGQAPMSDYEPPYPWHYSEDMDGMYRAYVRSASRKTWGSVVADEELARDPSYAHILDREIAACREMLDEEEAQDGR